MKLFRPVGLRELELIADSGWQAFPPRLPDQPIFYPVLTFKYAESIAKNWNKPDAKSGFAGFVTQFEVDDIYLKKYQVQPIGNSNSRDFQELWVPAEELEAFNGHILGKIEVVASYYDGQFAGEIDKKTGLPAHLQF